MPSRLKNPDGEPYKVFVAMPFGDRLDPEGTRVLNERFAAIEDECRRAGCVCRRVDKALTGAGIVERTQEWIDDSDIFIVDLSLARPNVYYELGYIDGRPEIDEDTVLLIAHTDSSVHFDVAHRMVCWFSSSEELRLLVRQGLPELALNADEWYEENDDEDDEER